MEPQSSQGDSSSSPPEPLEHSKSPVTAKDLVEESPRACVPIPGATEEPGEGATPLVEASSGTTQEDTPPHEENPPHNTPDETLGTEQSADMIKDQSADIIKDHNADADMVKDTPDLPEGQNTSTHSEPSPTNLQGVKQSPADDDEVPQQQPELRSEDGEVNVDEVKDGEVASTSRVAMGLQEDSEGQGQPMSGRESSASNSATSQSKGASTSSSGSASASGSSTSQESVYYIKWITFNQDKVPVITQNENGPCPLLAIMNVLLLKGKVKLASMLEMITSEQLMTYLGECIFENMPQELSSTARANYEQNMQDAMAVMYKLQTGLDVNVKFTGVGDFEYTCESTIFDLLEVSLYHGWLVDPQDTDTVKAVNDCSYNQLVERIITLRNSDQEDSVTKALIAEQFLERTASQLTYHGLCELVGQVKDAELCVFFRNNHFNTLYKHKEELFMLVTDQGFLTEPHVVWETLATLDGDGHFVDTAFRTYTKPEPPTGRVPSPQVEAGSPEQIDHDYLVALSLQEEARSPADQGQQSQGGQGYTATPAGEEGAARGDYEMAMRLQQEENRLAAERDQDAPRPPQPHTQQQPRVEGRQGRPEARGQSQSRQSQTRRRSRSHDRERKEEKNCCIL